MQICHAKSLTSLVLRVSAMILATFFSRYRDGRDRKEKMLIFIDYIYIWPMREQYTHVKIPIGSHCCDFIGETDDNKNSVIIIVTLRQLYHGSQLTRTVNFNGTNSPCAIGKSHHFGQAERSQFDDFSFSFRHDRIVRLSRRRLFVLLAKI